MPPKATCAPRLPAPSRFHTVAYVESIKRLILFEHVSLGEVR